MEHRIPTVLKSKISKLLTITDSGKASQETEETYNCSEMWLKIIYYAFILLQKQPDMVLIFHWNIMGYQNRRSAVYEAVTEICEIVSTGHHSALSLQYKVDSSTEMNWKIYFGARPAALSPWQLYRSLCTSGRSYGRYLTLFAWLIHAVAKHGKTLLVVLCAYCRIHF